MEEQGHKGDRKETEPEGLLYHYTDQSGLLGILDSKSIWATHIRYLNDASEFIHGINVARQCIKAAEINVESVLKGYPNEVYRRDTSRYVEDAMSEQFSIFLNNFLEIPVYVACFFDSKTGEYLSESQEVGDSLGQWRAYSKGSAGFSIGFDKGLLEEHIKKCQEGPGDLILFGDKCMYDDKEQRENFKEQADEFGHAITEFIKRSWEEFDENRGQGPTIKQILMRRADFIVESANRIIPKMAIPAVFMKHPAFRDEKEWRIAKIFNPKPTEVYFRPGKSSLVPYITISLPILKENSSSLIRRIIVGPSPEIENAVTAAKMLLISKGYKVKSSKDDDGVEVLPSKIPYRNW